MVSHPQNSNDSHLQEDEDVRENVMGPSTSPVSAPRPCEHNPLLLTPFEFYAKIRLRAQI